ncbi:MAG: Holliday junction branch migration protein RuvA [Candidatus Saccharibacteria bacterium]|nr:Holliday junction branch migration protein RuvA [Candidatus Saccharibacteria bacterium]
MIAHLKGILTEKFANSVIIDVHGVGYEVALSQIDFDNLNLDDEVKLYTYHHVREQSEELFGFTSLAAKKLFELLISVQGIGPKAAMAILSLAPAEEVRNAIANADAAYVSKASGVGKKSAERVIVDLRDKVGLPTYYGRKSEPQAPTKVIENDEALDALMALGLTLADATKALENIDQSLSVEERIRQALKNR